MISHFGYPLKVQRWEFRSRSRFIPCTIALSENKDIKSKRGNKNPVKLPLSENIHKTKLDGRRRTSQLNFVINMVEVKNDDGRRRWWRKWKKDLSLGYVEKISWKAVFVVFCCARESWFYSIVKVTSLQCKRMKAETPKRKERNQPRTFQLFSSWGYVCVFRAIFLLEHPENLITPMFTSLCGFLVIDTWWRNPDDLETQACFHWTLGRNLDSDFSKLWLIIFVQVFWKETEVNNSWVTARANKNCYECSFIARNCRHRINWSQSARALWKIMDDKCLP